MRTLDSLADDFQLERIDFMRLNIEGAEREAIKGMARVSPRIRNLFVSCHDFITDGNGDPSFKSYAEVEAFLEREGFEIDRRADEAGKPWLKYYLHGSR